MKGVRFYKDENGLGLKRDGPQMVFPNGSNGMAVLFNNVQGDRSFESWSGYPKEMGDGPYIKGTVSTGYLRAHCLQISEADARTRFPNLVKALGG